jgi:hypothetical protein
MLLSSFSTQLKRSKAIVDRERRYARETARKFWESPVPASSNSPRKLRETSTANPQGKHGVAPVDRMIDDATCDGVKPLSD